MKDSDTWKLKEAISQIKQKWHLLKRTCDEGRNNLQVGPKYVSKGRTKAKWNNLSMYTYAD